MVVSFALLIIFTIATFVTPRCPNSCSGHGSCGTSSVCTCYTGWNGGAADCSARECPFGTAWADKAYATDLAHQSTECSNAGYCDRKTGNCVCYSGFSGSACQRASCPNSCSGHGVCGTIHDISYFYGPDYNSLTSFAGDGYGLNYNYWDKYSSALCDCDTGYFGADCSLALCPKGDDPLTVNQNYRQIKLSIYTHQSNGEVGLEYAGNTAYISLSNPGNCGTSLSNTGSFGYVGCTYTLTTDSFLSFVLYMFQFTLTFYSWPSFPKENNLYSTNGNPSRYDFFCDITYADSTTYCIFSDLVTSNIREYAICSNRGKCNFNTGLCTCLDGFGGPSCSNVTYLHHHGSNSNPGLEVSISGLDYTSTVLHISSARSASSSFNFIEATAASETVFYVDGTGSVGINKLKSLTGGMTISGGGLNVDSGGLTISSDGMNVYSSSTSSPVATFSSLYSDYLTSSYVAFQISTVSSTSNHYLLKLYNQRSSVFSVQANGQMLVAGGGILVTGGISVNNNGIQVTGGVSIRYGGLSVSNSGITVTGGVTVNSFGLNIIKGGLQLFGGGMSIYSGGLKITAGGMSILSVGLSVTGGASVNSNGAKITGGVTVNSGGLYVTLKGVTVATGGMVITTGGLTVQNNGLYITTKGLTVNSGGVYITTQGLTIANSGVTITGGITVSTSGVIVTGGITVNSGGAAFSGGLTVFDSGMVVSGGLTVRDSGLVVAAGGLTVAAGAAAFNNGLNVASGLVITNGLSVGSGGLVITGGLTVYGSTYLQNNPVITSDRRLKTDVEPISDALQKVSRLQGVYFNWIQNEESGLRLDDKRHIGLMAQEVQAVLPEAVGESPLDAKYLGVDYTALIPLLVEAIHDLDDMVKATSYDVNNGACSRSGSVEVELEGMKKELKMLHVNGLAMAASIQSIQDEADDVLAMLSSTASKTPSRVLVDVAIKKETKSWKSGLGTALKLPLLRHRTATLSS